MVRFLMRAELFMELSVGAVNADSEAVELNQASRRFDRTSEMFRPIKNGELRSKRTDA